MEELSQNCFMTIYGGNNMETSNKVKDISYALIKGGVSSIPFVGGTAAELLSLAIASPMEKRRDEWVESVSIKISQLESNNSRFSVTELSKNDEFISLILSTTQIALRNHKKEKIEALRNIVINTILGVEPDEEYRSMFLNLIDLLTLTHLKLLMLFDNPEKYITVNNINFDVKSIYMGGLNIVIEGCISELKDEKDLYSKAFKDLYSYGLLNTESVHTSMSAQGLMQSRTTDFGQRLIKFISE